MIAFFVKRVFLVLSNSVPLPSPAFIQLPLLSPSSPSSRNHNQTLTCKKSPEQRRQTNFILLLKKKECDLFVELFVICISCRAILSTLDGHCRFEITAATKKVFLFDFGNFLQSIFVCFTIFVDFNFCTSTHCRHSYFFLFLHLSDEAHFIKYMYTAVQVRKYFLCLFWLQVCWYFGPECQMTWLCW